MVYPCVYREHIQFSSLASIGNGLSLCIQGTHRKIQKYINHSRFIPVYTGNTLEKFNKDLLKAVYPCVYREHYCSAAICPSALGLSLCIQGTLQDHDQQA